MCEIKDVDHLFLTLKNNYVSKIFILITMLENFISIEIIFYKTTQQPEMAVKRAQEEEEEERERPGRKRGRLETRGLGPQPPTPTVTPPVTSARTRQIVEEKLQQLEEQEDPEAVRVIFISIEYQVSKFIQGVRHFCPLPACGARFGDPSSA